MTIDLEAARKLAAEAKEGVSEREDIDVDRMSSIIDAWDHGVSPFLEPNRGISALASLVEDMATEIKELRCEAWALDVTLRCARADEKRAEESRDGWKASAQESETARREAVDEIGRLRSGLKEALEEFEEASQYKGEFLAKKHGDSETIARLRELLNDTH